jgi:mRNA interferase RelE/StbE
MRVAFTARAHEQYAALPSSIQAKFDKQLRFLLADLRHPSLRAKKYDESRNIWQARVDQYYRFYFQVQRDTYILLNIIPHPK